AGQDEQAGQDDGRAGRRTGTRRLEAGDPRRRPTFRFDTGDAEWARAMVAFQRAAMELLLAYRWAELDRLPMVFGRRGSLEKFIIPLGDAGRVRRAHKLILEGLTHADRCRAAYLAETDDDREWVPNPRQRSYAMPLAVDQALYQTWADILGDVRRMLRSEEGLSLRALAGLMDDELPALLPDAYLDLGALLREPTTVTLDLVRLEQLDHAGKDPAKLQPLLEALLRGVLGSGYAAKMKPSPLPSRLARIQRELDLGGDTLERKLRYLIWLN
ncbi:MAG TPA: hypothetical protein PKU97_22840, partial [Kofleriaceae bacterium]|nr:hypothetical protein [Kofleriaceae bacterium]